MRVASRVVGIVLALVGLIFVSLGALLLFLFHPQSVLTGSAFGRPALTGPAWAVGLGLLLLGWYYFKLDIDAPDKTQERPASRFAPYLLAHRRELRIIALIGLMISLIRFGAACFGIDWTGRWKWFLVLAGLGLVAIQGEVSKAKPGVPKAIEKAVGTAFLILILVWLWSQWSPQQTASRISQAALVVLLFAWDALSFQYVELRQ
jgi:hypothetical protein